MSKNFNFQNPSIHGVVSVEAAVNRFFCHDRDQASVDLKFRDKENNLAIMTVFFAPDSLEKVVELVSAINNLKVKVEEE